MSDDLCAMLASSSSLIRRLFLTTLLLGACQEQDPKSAAPQDGGLVMTNSTRDDAGNITRAVIQVAGMTGQGLVLLLDGTQQVPISGNGIWTIPVNAPSATLSLAVQTAPTQPAQRCEATQLDVGVFSVICHDQGIVVSGVINGYAGRGLRIALYDDGDDDDADEAAAHSIFSATAAGDFQFARPLKDDVSYHVEILQPPTEPAQDCVVSNAEGTTNGEDITNVVVDCTTKLFNFNIEITGLKGTGLTLSTPSGPLELTPDQNMVSLKRADGFQYDIEITKQPTNPAQTCFLQDNVGTIQGDNVTLTLICDAAGTLRISEVGACPFSGSSCWFEIINVGAAPEQLAFYKLRSSAISPSAFNASRIFTLPQITIPQFGTIVIQGKTVGSLADGQGVYHVGDGDVVPWWNQDGFVELLNPSGATASFIRWGANTTEPTTGGKYGGGSGPALPRGNNSRSYSIQHANAPDVGLPSGADFKLRAFATYGGRNDVSSDEDADDDGIPDIAEQPGATFGGLNLYDMGAREGRKDVFIEIDHMTSDDPAVVPHKEALDKLVEVFRGHNIYLHFDVGPLYASTFDPANYNLGGGNTVPFSKAIGLAPADPEITNLYDLKGKNMAANRRMVFYYQIFAWSQQKDGSGGSSGIGELPGNDSFITLGGNGLMATSLADRNVLTNYQAAAMMHELGHNFGLKHGGGDSINRKPNYVSVMNYLYSPLGLPTIGHAEGDRYQFYKKQCSVNNLTQLTNSPTSDDSRFLVDYSSGTGAPLDETALTERDGLGQSGSSAVDYNCNQSTDSSSYALDVNGDGALDTLVDNDDWSSLEFVFRRYSGTTGGVILVSVQQSDSLTSDSKHATDVDCPPPYIPTAADLN